MASKRNVYLIARKLNLSRFQCNLCAQQYMGRACALINSFEICDIPFGFLPRLCNIESRLLDIGNLLKNRFLLVVRPLLEVRPRARQLSIIIIADTVRARVLHHAPIITVIAKVSKRDREYSEINARYSRIIDSEVLEVRYQVRKTNINCRAL